MTHYQLPDSVLNVLKTLKDGHFQGYIVGGCVRDLMMNRPTNDWDFTTNATPEEILKRFPDGFYNNVFGTVGIPIKGSASSEVTSLSRVKSRETPRTVARHGQDRLEEVETPLQIYEITTFRTEQGYSDRRHPDKIAWGKSLEEDLARRDFTINAMAYDGQKIIDPFGGKGDVHKHLIKAVGDPVQRFTEDALRMLRAVRIAVQLQFLIEEQTFLAIKKHAALILAVSSERILDELIKILSTDYPADGFLILRSSGLLREILPEFDACFNVPQQSPKRHHIHDVGTHLIKSVQFTPSKDPIVRLATLLHDIGKPATFNKTSDGVITFYNHEIVSANLVRKIANRLHVSRDQREKLITLVRYHQFTVDERQTDSAIRRFIRNVGKENLDDMLALRIGDRLGGGARETSWRLELFKKRLEEVQVQPFTVGDLKVNGYDVMKTLNIKPGPMVGKVLNALFAEVEEDMGKNEREYLLKRIPEIE